MIMFHVSSMAVVLHITMKSSGISLIYCGSAEGGSRGIAGLSPTVNRAYDVLVGVASRAEQLSQGEPLRRFSPCAHLQDDLCLQTSKHPAYYLYIRKILAVTL